MDTNDDQEHQRQQQVERDFMTAREQLAADDKAAALAAEHMAPARDEIERIVAVAIEFADQNARAADERGEPSHFPDLIYDIQDDHQSFTASQDQALEVVEGMDPKAAGLIQLHRIEQAHTYMSDVAGQAAELSEGYGRSEAVTEHYYDLSLKHSEISQTLRREINGIVAERGSPDELPFVPLGPETPYLARRDGMERENTPPEPSGPGKSDAEQLAAQDMGQREVAQFIEENPRILEGSNWIGGQRGLDGLSDVQLESAKDGFRQFAEENPHSPLANDLAGYVADTQKSYHAIADGLAPDERAEQQPDALTLEALNDHPMSVLDRDIPADSSNKLLQAAFEAAGKVREFAETTSYSGDEAGWDEKALAARAEGIQEGIAATLKGRGIEQPPEALTPENPALAAANEPGFAHAVFGFEPEEGLTAEKAFSKWVEHENGTSLNRHSVATPEPGSEYQNVHMRTEHYRLDHDVTEVGVMLPNGSTILSGTYPEIIADINRIGLSSHSYLFDLSTEKGRSDLAQYKDEPGKFAEDQREKGEWWRASAGQQPEALTIEAINSDPTNADDTQKPMPFEELAAKIAGYESEVIEATEAGEKNRADLAAYGLEQFKSEARLGAAITDFLNEQVHELPSREIEEIAYTAAANNIDDRTDYDLPKITLEKLNLSEGDFASTAGLLRSHQIPDDADHYLLHRIHTTAEQWLDAITAEADTPWARGSLEHTAAVKALEIEAGERLEQSRAVIHEAAGLVSENVESDPWNKARAGDHATGQEAQTPQTVEPPSPSPETSDMCNFPADADTGDRFRMAADTTTNTPWGRLERDLGERIAVLEDVTGLQDDPAHRAYVVEQKDMGEQITATADPAERVELRREKDAHSQDYAASLLEKGQLALGNEGRYEESADMKQEAVLRREIAADLRGSEPPEITPPGKDEQAPADIGRDMAEAAQAALGRTAETAAVLEGPTVAEQRGQQPALQEIRSEAGRSDYADLRAATAELGENDDRAKLADHSLNIRPYMEVSPEGTYIASRPQSSFTDRETDYEAGPVRPGMVAAMESLADTRAVAQDNEREVEDTRIAAAAEKDKRTVEDTGRVMGAVTSDRESADPFAAMMQQAEQTRAAMDRMEEADREAGHDTGRAVVGGGGRGL